MYLGYAFSPSLSHDNTPVQLQPKTSSSKNTVALPAGTNVRTSHTALILGRALVFPCGRLHELGNMALKMAHLTLRLAAALVLCLGPGSPALPGAFGQQGACSGSTPWCSDGAHAGPSSVRYYLSVGAIFRDETRYLAEWLEFHLCQGVEHFFLYNHHSSSDDHEAVLAPYVAAGLVTLDDAVCDMHCQVPTYKLLMEQHAAKTRWLALIGNDN